MRFSAVGRGYTSSTANAVPRLSRCDNSPHWGRLTATIDLQQTECIKTFFEKTYHFLSVVKSSKFGSLPQWGKVAGKA